MFMKSNLGISLHNLANIQRGSAWKGLSPIQKHKRFCTFVDDAYGVRALFIILRTYSYKYKINSVSKIIHRYAPLCENNTYEYIANVCRWITEMYELPFCEQVYHVKDDEVFCLFNNPKSPTFFCKCLAKAIIRQETGVKVDDLLINQAISLL